MDIRLLGSVEVRVDGEPVELGPPQRRALLAAVAVDAGRLVPLETLVDRVWGEHPPARVRDSFYVLVSHLRRVLGQTGASVALVRGTGGYVLRADSDRIDLHRFRGLALAARARDCPDAERVGLLEQALNLWRGQALAGLAGEWVAQTRARWQEERLDTAVAWAQACLRVGRQEEVIGPARALVADYPLAEPLVAVLMRALAAAGREAEALDCYATTRARLAEELGTGPGADLRGLHESLLRGEPLEARRGGTPDGSGMPRVVRPAQLPANLPCFVGRDQQLAELDLVLAGAGDQPAAVVISAVSGTAGVGKTTLAVHWAHRVAGQFPDGQLFLNLRGADPAGPATPTEAVRTFLDALGVPAHRVPAGLDAQTGLYRTMLAGRRMLVLLDNARDAEQVRPLLPGAPGCLVVVTSRSQLTGLVTTAGAHSVAVDLLSVDEAREVLARRLGAQRVAAEPDAVDEIITRCARLPLALAIAAARAIARRAEPLTALAAELRRDSDRLDVFDGGDPSADVRAVFSWSYRILGPAAARLFRLLGPHSGPDVGVPAAASLAGVPVPEARVLLAELVRANLLEERASGRYACHDLLRAYAAEQARRTDTEAVRRAALHRALDHYLHGGHAAAMLLHPYRDAISIHPARPSTQLEEIADYPAAMAWFMAEHRIMVAAVDQAASAGFDTHAWQLAWTLTDFLDRQGHWPDWAASQTVALAAADRLGEPAARAHARRSLGHAQVRLGQDRAGYLHLRQALALYKHLGAGVSQAHTHLNLSLACERLGRPADALDHARQSLDLFRAAGDRAGQANALNTVGWYAVQLGDHHQAVTHCREAITLQREVGDRHETAATWDTLGFAQHHLGQHREAVTCFRTALDLWWDLEDHPCAAETLTHLGDTHDATGDQHAARAAWQQALSILTQLDHPDSGQLSARLARLSG